MGEIMQMIDAQIIRPRVHAAYQEGFEKTKEDIESFYSQGNPVRYVRTGALGDSPSSDPPSGGNGNYHYNIRLDDPSYSTGTYSGHTVLEAAQHNGSGILGKPGTWVQAMGDIKQALESHFSG